MKKIGSDLMIKRIQANNKIFNSEPFQKDKYKFFLILQNLESETLELYSDEENYILCRGEKNYPTWIWTKDNFDISLLSEMEEAINLFFLLSLKIPSFFIPAFSITRPLAGLDA